MKRLWWAIPVLGVLELALHFLFAGRAPDDAEWVELADQVRKARRADEVIVVAPHWAEPLARRYLANDAMPLRDVARPDVTRYATAMEIGLLGQRSTELETFSVDDQFEVGAFTVRRLINPEPQLVHFDFVDGLSPQRANVFQERGDQRSGCDWTNNAKVSNGALFGHATFPRQRFRCRGGDWSMVGVTVIDDQDYRPRRCLWAHPSDGRPLRIEFRDVEIGERIQGYAGITYFFSREYRGTPVRLEAWVGDDQAGEFQYRDGQGWRAFTFDTSRWRGERHRVSFRVSSKRAKRREFCFHADTRSALESGAAAARSGLPPSDGFEVRP